MAKIFRIVDIRKTLSLLESLGLNIDDIDSRPWDVIYCCNGLSKQDISLRVRNILDVYLQKAYSLIENSGYPTLRGSLK
jgi:hypothetical protein